MDERMVESLWACTVNYCDAELGRVGLNFHYEGNKVVASITNIQGKTNTHLSEKFNELIDPRWAVEAVDQIILNLPDEVDLVRGVAAKNHMARYRKGFDMHAASNLYDRTFRSDEISMCAVLNSKGEKLFYEKSKSNHS